MDCETLAGHGYTGVSVSPNGVFMALYESKRKLFHYKKGATAVEGEVCWTEMFRRLSRIVVSRMIMKN